MGLKEDALRLHQEHQGKIAVVGKVPVNDKESLSLAYTPGVAEPCREIHKNRELVYEYTSKGNLVAVVTDGTAVLGLGDIGPEAALPVMEGKAVLFKAFGGVDAFPICVDTKDPDEIVKLVQQLAPGFGGINLEDISAPRCFEIEQRLIDTLDIPVFHDDQHGTAVIVVAALINALKIVGKKKDEVRIAMSGAGAAAQAITRLLLKFGVQEIALCDLEGVIYEGKPGLDAARAAIAKLTNHSKTQGTLADIMAGADIFIGVSAANLVTPPMIQTMAQDPIIFAMANPEPEILPEAAKAGGAKIIGTGRSDFPNQINNVLAFPGIFRGALDVRASRINDEMKLAAAAALAQLVSAEELNADYIIPHAFDQRVAPAVAQAVAQAASATGVARLS